MNQAARGWGEFAVGEVVERPFTVTESDMAAFLALSGDDSRSHVDEAFCRAHGFAGRVVYGGLIAARLSGLLGTALPGALGLSNTWTLNFHSPLHVREAAVLRGEVQHVSEGTRTLKLGFRVTVVREDGSPRLVADGTVRTSVLAERP